VLNKVRNCRFIFGPDIKNRGYGPLYFVVFRRRIALLEWKKAQRGGRREKVEDAEEQDPSQRPLPFLCVLCVDLLLFLSTLDLMVKRRMPDNSHKKELSWTVR
jgi:hypothetical protein